MTEEEKWKFLESLDEQFLVGGVILSEWATYLIRDADTAFSRGAPLASIITGLAGVETHLRSEAGDSRKRFVDLIEESDLEDGLKQELHCLRKYRNKWVHVDKASDDLELLESPERHLLELEEMACRCSVALRRTIYSNPCI
ncbi:MAG TPA: hypothetical protein PK668_12660 [Myxococcota bacterium]|nr:hypothetical protein [Myxococcota bacterium]HRY93678.1 hypothetical protein [Myxococcota bacterium]